MKSKWIGLVLMFVLASVSFAFAGSANKKSITFTEPVVVDGIAIPPGDYKVEWSGNGPNVIVNFSRGNETFASVPAVLQAVKNPYDSAIKVRPQPSGAKQLVAIDWSKLSLMFAPEVAQGE